MPQQNAKATADARAGEVTTIELYTDDRQPTKETVEIVTNLDLVAGRWCVVNDYAGERRVCATE